MSNCCVNCFKDSFLRSKIYSHRVIGNCDYCRSRNQSVLNVSQLTSDIESFFNIYDVSQQGAHWELYVPSNAVPGEDFAEDIIFSDLKPLHEHIQNDWSIFSDAITKENRGRLLFDILAHSKEPYIIQNSSPETLFALYYDNIIIDDSKTTLWNKFCTEIKSRNRYILKSTPIQEVIVLLNTKRTILRAGESYYRARIGFKVKDKKISPYPKGEMGMAPANVVSDGRANPRGISYLYVASDEDTAVSEVRPWKSAKISVATISLKEDVEIVDLTMSLIESPFHDPDLRRTVELQQLLEAISMEFSKPVSPSDSGIDYIPTQYIAELIKSEGFKGFKFKSSIADGDNYVFFSMKFLEITESNLHEVTNIKINQRLLREN